MYRIGLRAIGFGFSLGPRILCVQNLDMNGELKEFSSFLKGPFRNQFLMATAFA